MTMYKRGAQVIAKLKDLDKKTRIISGYYTAFNNEDSDGDIGTKGMTLASIAADGPKSAHPRIKLFLNHDISHPLGVMKDMGEDDFGAWYVAEVGTHNDGEDFLKMADSGLITEHSYGLTPQKRDKSNSKRLTQVKVWEASPLTGWGANPMTPFIDLGKSMSKEDIVKYWQNKQAALEKFIKDSTATDELLSNLTLEIKYLTQHIIDLSTVTPEVKATAGTEGVNYSDILKNLNAIKF